MSHLASAWSAAVCAGLAEYARARGVDGDVVAYLENTADADFLRAAGQRRRSWRDVLNTLEDSSDVPAFAAFAAADGIDTVDLFVLGFVAEAQTRYECNQLIAELQGDPRALSPSWHLLQDMVDVLFGESWQGMAWRRRPLLERGAVTATGNGPLSTCTLRADLAFHHVLTGIDASLPGTRSLARGLRSFVNAEFAREIPRWAAMLDAPDIDGLALRGLPGSGRANVASLLAEAIGRLPVRVDARIWEDSALTRWAFELAGWMPVLERSLAPDEQWSLQAASAVPVCALLNQDGALLGSNLLELSPPLPDRSQRRGLWRRYLGRDVDLDALSGALLPGRMIHRIAQGARLAAAQAQQPVTDDTLLETRAALGGDRLRTLAQLVPPVSADAVIIPRRLDGVFDAIRTRTRRRDSLVAAMGSSLADARNHGLRLLFVGDSGTGKTLAASYVARRACAPLFRVDVASILNKYIGESEKNISALLADAAAVDAMLLLDEADSFLAPRGGPSQTDSGARFSAMLTNFLLTRLENHPGVVIMTTNARERIDSAFTRRLDYVVEFALPNPEERRALWRSHLGDAAPDDLLLEHLAAHCDLSGGHIRNIVLAAATATPERQRKVGTAQLLQAVAGEYRKLGRIVPPQIRRMSA